MFETTRPKTRNSAFLFSFRPFLFRETTRLRERERETHAQRERGKDCLYIYISFFRGHRPNAWPFRGGKKRRRLLNRIGFDWFHREALEKSWEKPKNQVVLWNFKRPFLSFASEGIRGKRSESPLSPRGGGFLRVDRAEEKRHVLAGADAAKRCDAKWEQWTTAAPIGKRDDDDDNNNNNTGARRWSSKRRRWTTRTVATKVVARWTTTATHSSRSWRWAKHYGWTRPW